MKHEMKYKEVFWLNKGGYTYFRFLSDMIKCEYRYSSIPGVGKNRWSFKHYYNHPKTTQELREGYNYPEYTRSKRKKYYLPTSWDDRPRGDIKQKNWKQCTKRKKQYKPL